MEFSKRTVYVKCRSKEDIEIMEKEFQYCQEHLDEERCKKHLFELFWEALRIIITKRTKSTDVYLWSWADRITDGTVEYMNRYEKNPNYRSPYLFKAAHWISLKVLYDKKFIEKYERKTNGDPMVNYESIDNCTELAYSSFEDDVISKLEKEGY